VCVSNILGYCANKVAVEDGGTCEEVSSVAKLTVNQLLGMNPQLSDSDCDDLPAGDVCVPAPTSGTVSAPPPRGTIKKLGCRSR